MNHRTDATSDPDHLPSIGHKIKLYSGGHIDHHLAEVITATDYYPFGMPMLNRSFGANYRFGFNKGSEKDDEIYGKGNAYSTLFRELDVRLGRWWTIDPKEKDTPNQSPYQVDEGDPIMNSDPNGDCPWCVVFVLYMLASLPADAPSLDHAHDAKAMDQARSNYDATIVTTTMNSPNFTAAYKLYKSLNKQEPQQQKTNNNQTEQKANNTNSTSKPNPTGAAGRGKNNLKPDPNAEGDHTTYDRDNKGNIYKYQEYKRTQTGHNDPVKRFDGGKPDGSAGAPHYDSKTQQSIPTPHVQIKGGSTSPATPAETPNNPRFNTN